MKTWFASTRRFSRGLALVLIGVALGYGVRGCVRTAPKAELEEVENNLAIMDRFRDISREDVARALSLSLRCREENREDGGCFGSAVQWYRVLGADAEADALIRRAPIAVKRSEEWRYLLGRLSRDE